MLTRTPSGAPPATTPPPGAIDTQTHVYLPGYAAVPGAMPLPPDPLRISEIRDSDFANSRTPVSVNRGQSGQG